MNTFTTGTALVLLCGIASAAYSGAASAATGDDDVPSVALHYDRRSLDTDSGARTLYRRIVNAAAEVCPQYSSSPHWISHAVRRCREESVARAVMKINNPHLAAVYAASTRNS
jgi:UrcA family protein